MFGSRSERALWLRGGCMRLEDKVAVITGGGNGLGRATALRFAAEGAQVVVADIIDELGEETAQMVNDEGGSASFVHCDAVSVNDNHAMAAHAVETYGGLDILVTAAGVSHPGYKSGDQDASVKWWAKRMDYFESPANELLDLDLDDFRQVMAINLDGTLLAAQACGAHMVEAGKGSIVTIASIAAKHPDAGPIPYVCSKSAVWMLTKKLSRLLATSGVRVNAIGPGYIDTHMTKMIDLIPEERLTQFFANIPMGRKGVPDEIANTALFLASDEASYFTGEILHPDGGYFTE